MARIWFITGASRGLGREWTKAALERGDQVVATARDVSTLDEFVTKFGDQVLALQLDVTDRAAVFAGIAAAVNRFGKLDIVVNNAGYGLRGAVEEVSEQEARAQIETNVFGALWVTQAAIAPMRAAGGGHIVQVSSQGGQIAFPALGLYHASKFALEGFTESLVNEVAPFGIKVTILEPGGFRTDWGGSSMQYAAQMPEYSFLPMRDRNAPRPVMRIGDPVKSSQALFKVVDDPNPPLRVVFGAMAFDRMQEAYHRRLAEWDKWRDVARSTEEDVAQ